MLAGTKGLIRFIIPIPAMTFLQITSICSFHSRVSSSFTPRQVNDLSRGTSWLFITTGRSSFIILRLCLDPIYITFVFVGWCCNLFLISHSLSLFISWFIFSVSFSKSFAAKKSEYHLHTSKGWFYQDNLVDR